VQQQQRQQRDRLSPSRNEHVVAVAGLDWAQDPELHGLVVPLFDRVRPVLDRASL